MSFGNKIPMGFMATMKREFEGDLPEKVWRSFRIKFIKEHAPGWEVKKLHNRYGRKGGNVCVTFRTTNPNTANLTADQWEFLKATLSLLAVKGV